jgi:hypothetical protein
VDHVRVDTDWVPEYLAAVRRIGERFERALFWRELLIVAVVAGVLVLRGLFS